MTTIQLRNESMMAIASADLNPALDRNLAAEFYDADGTQTFTGVITVNLDSIKLNVAPTVFSLSSDVVSVLASGIFMVSWHITAGFSTGPNPAVATAWLEEDTGGGFVEVPATRSYVQMTISNFGSMSVTSILRILAGYDYRLRVQRFAGTDTLRLTGDGARLSFVCLYATP